MYLKERLFLESMEAIVDTSVWLKTMSEGRDIISAIEEQTDAVLEPVLMNQVEEELKGLSIGNTKKAGNCRAALKYIETRLKQKTLKRLDKNLECSLKKVDDSILCTAKEHGYAVLTQDLELARRARARDIRVYVFRKSGKIGD